MSNLTQNLEKYAQLIIRSRMQPEARTGAAALCLNRYL